MELPVRAAEAHQLVAAGWHWPLAFSQCLQAEDRLERLVTIPEVIWCAKMCIRVH